MTHLLALHTVCVRYYDDKFIYGVSGATLQQKMGSEVHDLSSL